MHRKRSRRFLWIWKKSELNFCLRRERLTFGARRGLAAGAARGGRGWGRWKYQHRKIVYLSPYVEKPFNSKVIKCFVPELRSRKDFRVFRIPYVYFTYSCMGMLHIYIYIYIYIYKCVSFSRKDFGLCIHHLFVWSNLNFGHNSYLAHQVMSSLILFQR